MTLADVPLHVIERFAAVGDAPSVVTVGNFDGVHRGHQWLIERVALRAREFDVRPVVVTFEPHPVSVLRPEQPIARIALPTAKLDAIHRCGIEDIVVVPFDQEFASQTAEQFLDLVRIHLTPRQIIVGEGFRFGRGRKGDAGYIEDYANRHGFQAEIIQRVDDENGVVSSSRIRAAISAGDVSTAAELLGRRFRLRGVVERGFARGRELGYPTANLMVFGELVIPNSGIFAAYVHIRDGVDSHREGLIYIGTSPTFEPRDRTVEAHILDFDGDLYARNIEVEFLSRIRGDEKFESIEALVDQIREDEATARAMFRESRPEAYGSDEK